MSINPFPIRTRDVGHDNAAPAAGSSRSEARLAHIFAVCYVEQARARTRLESMHGAASRKAKWRHTPTTLALWQGICALKGSRDGMLEEAVRSGHLLMCWEGSSIVEFYDAQKAVPA